MHISDDITVLSVEALTSAWLNRSVRPNPEYQRGSTWKLRQQQLLVDSVLRGYPLPRFYFERKRSRDVLGQEQTSLEVIDGQQRLIALAQYTEDKWPLFAMDDEKVPLPTSVKRQPAPWAGKTFSMLSEALRQQLLTTSLSVVMIDQAAQDEVRDLFIRLQAGTALSAQQVRDAWPGNIGPFIETLAGKGQRRGRFEALFTAVDRRGRSTGEEEYDDPYLDARVTCAQLLTTFLSVERGRGLVSLTPRTLNDLYHENSDFDTGGRHAARFLHLLELLEKVLTQRPASEGRRAAKVKKSRVFSLFLYLRVLAEGPFSLSRGTSEIARAFWEPHDEREPVGRAGAAKTLEEHFVWFSDVHMSELELPELDRQRLFSESQKDDLWMQSGGQCAICGKEATRTYVEFDHVQPWVLGGRTEVANGRVVHPACHARGVKALLQGPAAAAIA